MPQVSHLLGVYAASPMLDPASPLRISVAWTCVAGVPAAAHLFNTPEGTGLSAWIALWFTSGLAGLLLTHFLYNRWLRSWYRRGALARRLFIAGMEDSAVPLAHHLCRTHDESVRVLGLFCPPGGASSSTLPPPYPILGGWADLEAFASIQPVDAVVIAFPCLS